MDLRQRRLAAGLTQRELAERAGCTKGRVVMKKKREKEQTEDEKLLHKIWCRDHAPENKSEYVW